MEIKNLKKAAKRILSSCKKNERIILFGDADLDGTASVIILEEAIRNLGGKVSACYFPDREIEGYGLNAQALKALKKYAPGILILLDCGIGNFKEIEEAKKMGFTTIVIEHHEILDKIPSASIVVDPKQKGDKYPFKLLATCGLAFKLAEELLGDKMPKNIRQSFLELVALGTLADMMPQTDDNQLFIQEGLAYLPFTFRPGLRALLKFFEQPSLSTRELSQKIISLLQITDCQNHLTMSYLLLSTPDEKKAQKLVDILWQKNRQRQEALRELTREIAEKLGSPSMIVFEGGEEIPHVLTGALASRLCNKFKKPTFIFNANEKLSRG